VGGFDGTTLPETFARALHADSPEAALVGIDQEGGRVARLGAPLLRVPPMRTLASWGDVELAERIARTVARQLAALGFTIDFAPVLDVNTCAANPVIGDRAFGDDADTCARFGTAWIRGLQSAGVLACGKHFPGHGDTTLDSHVDLPSVDASRERLDAVELVPFRAAAAMGVASIMTAHVVYPALDPRVPATLSRAVCTELRGAIGFRGMLVSDDLEMQAIAARWSIEDAAVAAVAAGCDAILVCGSDEKQERAVDALVTEAERSPAFRARCDEALARVQQARKRATARPLDDAGVLDACGGPEALGIAGEIARRLGAAGGAG
jgi:beta-N-acetylhexosaminidase